MTPLETVKWIHGAPDCALSTDPLIQVHAFDDDSFILRLSKCYSFEGNLIYLLFGDNRAAVFDTRWPAEPAGPRRGAHHSPDCRRRHRRLGKTARPRRDRSRGRPHPQPRRPRLLGRPVRRPISAPSMLAGGARSGSWSGARARSKRCAQRSMAWTRIAVSTRARKTRPIASSTGWPAVTSTF